jgi:uncharacterized protein YjbJ (UPF0337 family)
VGAAPVALCGRDKEIPMNWTEIEGRWTEFRGQVKSKWAKLSDDDVTKLEGKRDRLIGSIQSRYGIAREQAERQIEEWVARLEPSRHASDDPSKRQDQKRQQTF